MPQHKPVTWPHHSILWFYDIARCSYEDKRSRVAFEFGGWILLVRLVLDFRTISKVLLEVDLFTDFIVSLFLWNIELWLHYRVAALCRLACIRLFNFLTDMLTAVCTVIYRAPFFAIIISCPSLNCDCKPSHAQTHIHTHKSQSLCYCWTCVSINTVIGLVVSIDEFLGGLTSITSLIHSWWAVITSDID